MVLVFLESNREVVLYPKYIVLSLFNQVTSVNVHMPTAK